MNPRAFVGVLLFVALAPHASAADGERRAVNRFSSLKPPPSLQTVGNDRLSKSYRETRCVDFKNRATKIDLGTLCESSSKDFLKDMGVLIPTSDIQTPATSLDNAVVATPWLNTSSPTRQVWSRRPPRWIAIRLTTQFTGRRRRARFMLAVQARKHTCTAAFSFRITPRAEKVCRSRG